MNIKGMFIVFFITLAVGIGTIKLCFPDPPSWARTKNLPDAEFIPDDTMREHLPAFKFIGLDGGSCTAFVVYNNYAITAGHCVDYIDQEFIVKETKARIKAVFFERSLDRAILKGDFSKYKFIPVDLVNDGLHDSAPVVIYCGYPGGSNTINCKKAQVKAFHYFHVLYNGPVMPGMSGGPVINALTGQAVGIINAAMEDGALNVSSTVGLFDAAHIKAPPN